MPRVLMKACSIRYEMSERCDSSAALGRPVVPLVKMRMNGSSSPMGRVGERCRILGQAREVALDEQRRDAGVAVETGVALLVDR